MQKRWSFLLIIVLLGSIIMGCNSSPTVATVDGEKITRDQLDKRVNLMLDQFERMYGMTLDATKDKDMLAEVRQESLNNLVQEKLLVMEAKRRSIKADNKEVESNLANVKTSMGGDQKFKDFLTKTKLTEKDVKAILVNQSLVDQLKAQVTKDVKVSSAEAQDYFNKNPGKYDTQRELQVSHILVKTEKEAVDIIAQLKKGADFAKLAKEKSTDEASAAQGGDLGWINQSTNFVPEFLNAAMALKPGQMTEKPIKSEYGYHIIKCFAEHPAQKATFAAVAVTVQKDALAAKKSDTFNTFTKNLEKKAKIKKYPENYTDKSSTKDTTKDTSKDSTKGTSSTEKK
ncbi:MAG: peptidylprolyl isomerase [Methylocystaceae bacterium]